MKPLSGRSEPCRGHRAQRLSVVNQTLNTAGQTVRRLRASDGGLYEVVTDTTNRILSSRKIG